MTDPTSVPPDLPISPKLIGQLGLAAVLIYYAAAVGYSAPRLSPAYDEPIHIRCGMTMLTRSAYVDTQKAWWTGIDPMTPPMDMLPAALARWSGESPDYRDDFFTAFPHLRVARWANHALGVVLLLLVFFWGREVGGELGGALAAGLVAVNPLFLAHAAIVSSDLYAAVGGTAAAWAIWRGLLKEADSPEGTLPGPLRPALLRAAAVGVALGFAVACKLSNLALFAIVPLALAIAAWSEDSERRMPMRQGLARAALLSFVAISVGLVFAAAAFGFGRGELPPIQIAGRPIRLGFFHSLAYSAWTTGDIRGAHGKIYMLGRLEWPSPIHFAAAWLMQTPPPILALQALVPIALGMRIRREGRWAGIDRYLLAIALGLGVFFATRGIYLGLRHLMLPIVLFSILGAALARLPDLTRPGGQRAGRPPIAAFAVPLFLLLAAVEGARVAPWHLSYQNPITPPGLAFVDGDWGQGLLALKEWEDRHSPDEPILLAYGGISRPEDYGVRYRGLLSPFSWATPDPALASTPAPADVAGIVAISTSQLAGIFMPSAGKDWNYYAAWRMTEPTEKIAGGTIYIYDRRATPQGK